MTSCPSYFFLLHKRRVGWTLTRSIPLPRLKTFWHLKQRLSLPCYAPPSLLLGAKSFSVFVPKYVYGCTRVSHQPMPPCYPDWLRGLNIPAIPSNESARIQGGEKLVIDRHTDLVKLFGEPCRGVRKKLKISYVARYDNTANYHFSLTM